MVPARLKKIPVFADVDAEELAHIASLMAEVSVPEGKQLVREADGSATSPMRLFTPTSWDVRRLRKSAPGRRGPSAVGRRGVPGPRLSPASSSRSATTGPTRSPGR